MKAPSPLLGFNNNVKHKGRVFHIQTEDSGIRHPHIITHLFADGGRILKSTKTSYAEHVEHDGLSETVRRMMQDQHKAMFIALRDGAFDYLFEDGGPGQSGQHLGAARASGQMAAVARPSGAVDSARGPVESSQPSVPSAPATSSASFASDPIPYVAASAPDPVLAAPAPPAEAASPDLGPRKRPSRPKLQIDSSALHSRTASPTAPTLVDLAASSATVESTTGIDLDLEALERAAAVAQTPFNRQVYDLPPPPASVLGPKRTATGSYSVRPPPGLAGEGRPARRSSPPGSPSTSTPPDSQAPRRSAPPAAAGTTEGTSPRRAPQPSFPESARPEPPRYAPSRPAAIFAASRPQEGVSIFGEDLISEKSLDEVILGYLAEDLDSPSEKK